MSSNSEQMKSVIRYMRSSLARAMRGVEVRGREIAADPDCGRRSACWLHEAKGAGSKPVVFEIHGGGFALGDARKEDALCEWVRDSFDVHVVGLDYRLAPENPAPTALDDVLASIAYVASGAECDVDVSKLVVLGYSAGASLALAAAFASQTRDDIPAFAGLALHYPFLDAFTPPDALGVRDIDLPVDLMKAFNGWYVNGGDARDASISPVFASDGQLALLPGVAMFPVLGDELFGQAERLRERMEAAGVDVLWRPVCGQYHGYIEDAANISVYEAITMPETIAARPANYVEAAEQSMRKSLEALIGPASRMIPFDGGRGFAP